MLRRVLAIPLLFAAAAWGQDRPGDVRGTVVDLHGAVIPGSRVVVESPEHRCETSADGAGRFNCEVPAGQYRVTATGYSFQPYQRAPITVHPTDHLVLTLSTVPGPERGLMVDDQGAKEYVGMRLPIKQHSEVISGNVSILIRFITNEQTAGRLRFHGPYLMLTSETLSVYAEELLCAVPIRTCTAKGAVRIEIGEETLEDVSAEVDLVSRYFKLARSPAVSRSF